jgi:hypothetical protein
LRKLFFQKKVFLHGEKENFEKYSLFLESAELTFAILINYSAEKNQTCPRATVFSGLFLRVYFLDYTFQKDAWSTELT